MTGRPQVRRVRGLGRHTDGMRDDAGLHLVVAHESREDRQAGRVGRCPAGRSQRVRVEVPDRPRPCGRTRRAVLRVVELVEGARRRVDHDGVAVAGGVLTAFNGRRRAERIRPWVALVGVLERDGHPGLRRGHDGIGNAVGSRRVARGPEVGMQVRRAGIHAGQPRRAVGVDREVGDGRVPDVVRREHGAVRRAGHGRAGGRRRRRTNHGEAQPHRRGRHKSDPSRGPASSHERPLPAGNDRTRPAGRARTVGRARQRTANGGAGDTSYKSLAAPGRPH